MCLHDGTSNSTLFDDQPCNIKRALLQWHEDRVNKGCQKDVFKA